MILINIKILEKIYIMASDILNIFHKFVNFYIYYNKFYNWNILFFKKISNIQSLNQYNKRLTYILRIKIIIEFANFS